MYLPSSSFKDKNVCKLHSIDEERLGVDITTQAFLYSILWLLKQSKSLPLAALFMVTPIIKIK